MTYKWNFPIFTPSESNVLSKNIKQFEQAERSFTLPSGMASVYIYRPYNYLWSGLMLNVTIDDKELGKFIPTTCLLGNIVPGKHVIKVNRWMEGVDSSSIVKELDAEPGKIYFFKIIPGWWRNFKIKQVIEKEGLREISGMISSLNLAREEWDTLKNIAIVPARFLPGVDEIRPYLPEGRMSGALKDASDGAAIGARIFTFGMTDSLGALFFMMLGTLAGGVVGAVDGAIGADPKKSEAEM